MSAFFTLSISVCSILKTLLFIYDKSKWFLNFNRDIDLFVLFQIILFYSLSYLQIHIHHGSIDPWPKAFFHVFGDVVPVSSNPSASAHLKQQVSSKLY